MKNTLAFIAMLGIAAFSSCKKDNDAKPAAPESKKPAVTLLSQNGGEHYFSGHYITVKWKSSNITPESLVWVRLTNSLVGCCTVIVTLQPQHKAYIAISGATQNDGEEIFQLPADDGGDDGYTMYHQGIFGNTFKVSLLVLVRNWHNNGGWEVANVPEANSEDFFTVALAPLPSGCLLQGGYSTTTGQPCIPIHR